MQIHIKEGYKPITKRKAPPLIQALSSENQEFGDALASLQQAPGVKLALRTQYKTPASVVGAFDRVKNTVTDGYNGDTPLLIAKAIVTDGTLQRNRQESDQVEADLNIIRNGIQNYTSVIVRNPADAQVDMAALARVNAILQSDPSVRRYAIHRLTWDMTEKEKKELWKVLGWASVAAIGGHVLESFLAPSLPEPGKDIASGAGYFVTGQIDDVTTTFSNIKTEKGGRKSIKQGIRENRLTIGTILGAAVVDTAIMPSVFKHTAVLGNRAIDWQSNGFWSFLPHIQIAEHIQHTPLDFLTQMPGYWPAVAGALFALTAFAGSLSSKVSNIARSVSTIKKLDQHGLLPGRDGKANTLKFGEGLWLGIKENQSNPFRVGLLLGIGASLAVSLLASYNGLLEGNALSSAIQSVIGPLETISAFAFASPLAETLVYRPLKGATDRVRFALRRGR